MASTTYATRTMNLITGTFFGAALPSGAAALGEAFAVPWASSPPWAPPWAPWAPPWRLGRRRFAASSTAKARRPSTTGRGCCPRPRNAHDRDELMSLHTRYARAPCKRYERAVRPSLGPASVPLTSSGPRPCYTLHPRLRLRVGVTLALPDP